jgi:hypothetical protein
MMLSPKFVALSAGTAGKDILPNHAIIQGAPSSGLDLAAMDLTVRPQEDCWRFANGKWLTATPIPADRSAWDTFSQ